MSICRSPLVALFVVSALASPSPGQSSYPMVMGISPLAVQAGATSEHEVAARYNLYGTYQVLVSGQGVTGEAVLPEEKKDASPPSDAKSVDPKPDSAPPKKPEMPRIKIRLAAAADALPGVRDVRLATPQGVSTLGQIVVVGDPVVRESGKNNALAEANPVTLPATICGTIEANEDVDHFKFSVAAGQTFSFHVRAARMQDKIHDLQTHVDPIIALKNSTGTVLATSDNRFFADPFLCYTFANAGEYFLEIRDVRYQGNAYWHYAIEAHARPVVTQVFPMGVAPGAQSRVQLVGYNLPQQPLALVDVPADAPEGPAWLRPQVASSLLDPVPVFVSRLPQVVESDGDNDRPESAQEIAVPCAVSGRIERPGDVDCFVLAARKGDRFTFETMARRHQSELDPNLRVLTEKGARQTENDDLSTGRHTFADSLVENWTAPADGRYVVEVRDLHLRGGPGYVYVLSVTPADPTFRLEVDTDKTVLTPGVGGVIFTRAYRKNGFDGEIALSIDGLPDGVSAACGRILRGATDGCIVLSAAPDAPLGAVNTRITGRAEVADGQHRRELLVTAAPLQETYMPGGGRGFYPVDAHTVSVADRLDIAAVKVSPSEIVLKPGQSQRIEIEILRTEGFDKNVTLEVIYKHLSSVYGNCLPPGVVVDDKASKTLLTAKENKGYITLKAAADASPCAPQIVPVMANVAINFVMKMSYCGPPCLVSVADK